MLLVVEIELLTLDTSSQYC